MTRTLVLFLALTIAVARSTDPGGNTFLYLQSRLSFPISTDYTAISTTLSVLGPGDVYLQTTDYQASTTTRHEYTLQNEGLLPVQPHFGIASFEFDEAAQTAAAVFLFDDSQGHAIYCAAVTSLPQLQNDMSRNLNLYYYATPPMCSRANLASANVLATLTTPEIAAYAVLDMSGFFTFGGVNNLLQQWSTGFHVGPNPFVLDSIAGNANLAAVIYRQTGIPTIQFLTVQNGAVTILSNPFIPSAPNNVGSLTNIQLGLDANNFLYILYYSPSFVQVDMYELTISGLTMNTGNPISTGVLQSTSAIVPILQVNKRGINAYVFLHEPAQYFLLEGGVKQQHTILGVASSNVIAAGINQVDTGLAVLYGDPVGGLNAAFECLNKTYTESIKNANVDPAHTEVNFGKTGRAVISNQCDYHAEGTFFGVPFATTYNVLVVMNPVDDAVPSFQDHRAYPVGHRRRRRRVPKQ